MFDRAVASGYKSPKYRAEGLLISRAPDHGNNPGFLYVKEIESETYFGKIGPDMRYKGNSLAIEPLAAIALDPTAAAIRYGNRTGRCACCGRELTKDESIARGIGPICAERWGLMGMQMNPTKDEAKAKLNETASKLGL
jgi:hypothetical protein